MMKKILICVVGLLSTLLVYSQDMTGVRIYINPGHGGYDSDDRNMVIYPFTSGDPNGFWESQSNLDKGMMLKDMLDNAGASTAISRTQNRTQDDLALSTIVRLANEFNSDFMLSIHTNAGVNNYILMLYSGVDPNDTYTYPSATPHSDLSRTISTVIAQNLYTNEVTTWGATYGIRGDKTFARQAMGWSNGYGVLRGLTVPGVISEGAMHDYIPETYRLMNMEYKWMEAWHFYKSFAQHFQCGAIATGNIAGSVRDGNNKLLFPEFYKIKNSRDELLPIHNALVLLIQGTDTLQSYTTDNMYNGFYLFKNVAPGTYSVVVKAANYYDHVQTVQVLGNQVNYANVDMNMVRSTPPVVVSHIPAPTALTDSVEVATDIVLNFNWDMDEDATRAAFSITPSVAGTITFEDSRRTLRFTPSVPLEKATDYEVKLDTMAAHPDTTQVHHLATPFILNFRTKNRNKLGLVLSYPQAGDSTIGIKPNFMLVFDKKISTSNLTSSNIAKYIVVKDQNGNTIKTNTRLTNNSAPGAYGSIYFDLTGNMTANTNYTLTLAPEITDISGVMLTDTVVIPFRTYTEYIGSMPLIDGCEQTSFTYVADNSLGTASGAVIRNTSKKRYDQACNEFMYTFNDANGEAYYSFNNRSFTVNRNSVLGLHLLGDFSMNELWLECSIDGDIRLTKVATMDFADWRYIEVSFADVLPAGTDYTLSGLKLIRKHSILSQSGSFFIDNISKQDILSSVTESVSDALIIYPNPAKEVLYIGVITDTNCRVSFYSITGELVKVEQGTQVNVSDMVPGLYLVKIESNGSVNTKRVIIQ